MSSDFSSVVQKMPLKYCCHFEQFGNICVKVLEFLGELNKEEFNQIFRGFDTPCYIKNKQKIPIKVSVSGFGPTEFKDRFVVR